MSDCFQRVYLTRQGPAKSILRKWDVLRTRKNREHFLNFSSMTEKIFHGNLESGKLS